MKAFRLHTFGEAPGFRDVEEPVPVGAQTVVSVAAVGLCHSDLTMMQIGVDLADALGWKPFTLGHEVTGWVSAVGPEGDRSLIGTPVAVASTAFCGECAECRAGRTARCRTSSVGRGYGRDGGLAAKMLVERAESLVPLDGVDPFEAPPLTDAAATAMMALRRVRHRLGPGTRLTIIGVGGLGSYAVQIARTLTDAEVVASDTDPARVALARELGAHVALGPGERYPLSDVVIDIVGTDDTIRHGLRSVRVGGAFGLVGAAGGTFHGPWYSGLPRDAEIFTMQGSDLVDLRECIELVREGRMRVLCDHVDFEDVASAYDDLAAHRLHGRAVVRVAAGGADSPT